LLASLTQWSGLKSQHVTAIEFLASVTDAKTEGLFVGSDTLTFIPRLAPTALPQRRFNISAPSGAASTLLILQTIFPFLLFAAGEPIQLSISGGTNAAFSLSYEYLDQILLPTLEERFAVKVGREMKTRGWSLGKQSRGEISITIHPIQKGEKLRFTPPQPRSYPGSFTVTNVDVNIVTPAFTHEILQTALVENLGQLYPDAELHFKSLEDSGDPARVYILLVAHSPSNIRWGRDILTSLPKKLKSPDTVLKQFASKVCRHLDEEVALAGEVDEFLQDQLICFQAIAEGYSSFLRLDAPMSEEDLTESSEAWDSLTGGPGGIRVDRGDEPFGHGSLHAQTARWVAAEMLPQVKFYRKGTIAQGAGVAFS
jgi:RNA 3'-terminal phosphate cyclase (ATP)